jgi:hypothetical protein
MKRFWDTVIGPVLRATGPKSIVEVGSDKGENTANILGFCEETDAVLHVVDPVPKYDVAEWEERYGRRFVFHEALSLDAIPKIDRMDLVFLDGDHNWYTVYNELKAIDARCAELGQPFPLVMLHDIDWPFGRRDLYYDPGTIPQAYRRPYDSRGMRPGSAELLEEGGINRHLQKAVEEGGPKNGVLTAVEDFLGETDEELGFVRVPGFHGLGMLVPSRLKGNATLTEILEVWDLAPAVARHVENLEDAWLRTEIQRQEEHVRLNEALRNERLRIGDINRELRAIRRRLAQAGRARSGDEAEELAGLAEELRAVISRLASRR